MNLQQFREQLISGKASWGWIASLPQKWQHLPPYLRLYAAILIVAGLIFQLSYPIILLDSDMWYHLNGGRYFWQNNRVPGNSYFSFIAPERTFVNYYWGFQALIAKVYELWNYQGLLILRTLLFTLTTLVAYRYIIEEKNQNFPVFLFVLLFIAYFTFIEGRLPNLRPHLFSHFFILLFLYILERRPRWAALLPVITAAWVNIHGIEYPVPVLIGGAYFIEIAYLRLIKKESKGERGWREAFWLLMCAPALFATPHGMDLLETPFTVSAFVNLYISEMKALSPRSLYSVLLSGDNLKIESIFPIAFLFCTFAVVRSLLDGSLRISHAIMALGAYFLLFRGTRFLWEWALLVLPLITHYTSSVKPIVGEKRFISVVHLLMVVLMILPFVAMVKRLPSHADYPFDKESAPIGITRFLQQIGNGGKLLSPPSSAGFLHWELYPNHLIYADLQMSLFNDLDIYSLFSFYRNENGFTRTINTYKPDYVTVSRGNKGFKKIIGNAEEYVPVFAGNKMVLYANRHSQPEVVEKYQLRSVNPYALNKMEDTSKLDSHILELERMLEVYPESDRINHAITRLLFNEKRFEDALPWALRFVKYQPENANSHYLLGNIYENTDQYEKAIDNYNQSMKYADKKFKLVLHSHIGSCAYAQENFEVAYRHLRKAINPYNKRTLDADIYQLAFSAFIVGEFDESVLLLKMIVHNAPEEKSDVVAEAGKLLSTLIQHEDDTPSFFGWLLSLVFDINEKPNNNSL